MKSTGIIRNIDELGRIVIPKEIRKKLKITEGTPLEIYQDGESLVLKKYHSGCIFCGSSSNLLLYNEKLICKKCLSNLLELDKENPKQKKQPQKEDESKK